MSLSKHLETIALHEGFCMDNSHSRGIPVHRTSSYLFDSTEHAADLFALRKPGNIYTRMMNPTQEVLEKRVAALEGGEAALAVASGTSAIFYTAINICEQGDEIVSTNNLYGGTFTLFNDILPGMGIKTKFTKGFEGKDIESLITEKTRMIFTEGIGNPVLNVADIDSMAKVAKKYKIPLVIDSTFTTPYLFKPIEHGADIVVHSLTKWLGGQGAAIGGIVVDSGKFDWTNEKFCLYNKPDSSYHGLRYAHDITKESGTPFICRMRLVPLRNLGACISPDNAWMILQGLETFTLRMQRHCENAFEIAKFLKNHKMVEWVRYPGLESDPSYPAASRQFKNGFGGMVVFGIKGGYEAGKTFIDNLKLVSHLANVGDTRSLAIHPASTTHSQLSREQQLEGGITEDLIRLSVGIEHVDDIRSDLQSALSVCEGICR
ncbi:MAG: O-acetylhomoserine aminocarboxypropyltransferase/cysteine synthase [Fibrobacter sp.]|nr:O-acetylhomoserine aminocarboxypropyltransferase/cysteine synthase [Fibrobacter sp.]